ITAKYVPATEVAGDWYHHWHNERTGESVVFMADVSGHGAGSSMFTAIIAGIFKHLAPEAEFYPVERFLETVNKLILELGSGQWHASVQVVRFVKGETQARIRNAGHPPPVHVTRRGQTAAGPAATSIMMQSSVLGLEMSPKFAMAEAQLAEGDCIL